MYTSSFDLLLLACLIFVLVHVWLPPSIMSAASGEHEEGSLARQVSGSAVEVVTEGVERRGAVVGP